MLALLHLGIFRPAFKSIKTNWSASNKKNYSKFSNILSYLNIKKKSYKLLTSLFHKL